MTRSCVVAFVVVAIGSSISVATRPLSGPDSRAECLAVAMPTVEGMPGNAVDVAGGIRDMVVSYLTGPAIKSVALEAKLPSQAIVEAREKGCGSILFASVARKSGGRLAKALGQAAGNSAWYLPGGGSAASTAARAAAAGGLQAVSSIAASTKAKDEIRFEYRLQSAAGQVEFGPRTETQKATADGEDIVTPVVMRAAESIVTRKAAR